MIRFVGALFLLAALIPQAGSRMPEYAPPSILLTGISNAYYMAVGDFDNDGDQDFALAMWEQQKFVWCENNGARPPQFTVHTLVEGMVGAHDIVAGDLNGDGWLDLVTVSRDKVYWFRNLKTQPGTFALETLNGSAQDAWSASITDMTNDGKLDVLLAGGGPNRATIYVNNGATPVPSFTTLTIPSNSPGSAYVRGADFDHDGLKDLIVSSSLDKKLTWHKNNGNGTFTEYLISTEGWTVEICDLDRDGWMDFVANSLATQSTTWYRNTGLWGHVAFQPRPLLPNITDPQAIWPNDYDKDGDPDVLIATSTAHKLVWCNTRSYHGAFEAHEIDMEWTFRSWNACTVDLDGDGDLDLLCLGSTKVFWMENKSGPTPDLEDLNSPFNFKNAAKNWANYE